MRGALTLRKPMIVALRRRIAQRLRRRLGVPEISTALDAVALRGFEPRLVFDIGAYRGDFALDCLRRWPSARVACFEPLESQVTRLRHLASRDPRLVVFDTLLGANDGATAELHEAETASSVLPEHASSDFPVRKHSVRSVDAVVGEHFDRPPDLLKIDVQGYELEVLKGAERSLHGARLALIEVNLLDIHRGVPLVSDVVGWLAERDWVAYDICGLTRRPLDGALWQADLLFVPIGSDLRADKRWIATPRP